MSGVEVSGTGVLLEHQWKGGGQWNYSSSSTNPDDYYFLEHWATVLIFININIVTSMITDQHHNPNVTRVIMHDLLQKVPRQHVDSQGANGQNPACDTNINTNTNTNMHLAKQIYILKCQWIMSIGQTLWVNPLISSQIDMNVTTVNMNLSRQLIWGDGNQANEGGYTLSMGIGCWVLNLKKISTIFVYNSHPVIFCLLVKPRIVLIFLRVQYPLPNTHR